jgi:hypothetical protein
MKDLGQLCCCGVKADRHPTTICEKFHNFDMSHHHRPADHELLHLLAMKAVWPRGAGRQRFKTELHLDRAIEQCLDKALLEKRIT